MSTLLPRSQGFGDLPAHSASPSTFGALLKRYRQSAGLSQELLAERAHLSIRGISDLERGVRRLPRRDTLALLATALTLSPSDQRAFEAAALGLACVPATPDPRSNLPSLPTSLIGRADELAGALARLRSEDVRLLTLTGAGGVGKTRLAQAVGWALLPDFSDGVWQIELASIRETHLVIAAIAGVIGVEQTSGASLLEGLIVYLREARTLLVLDNFEHLLDAAPIVAILLQSCPLIRLLITSRAPLHLRGEHELLVRPFAVPDADRLPTLDEGARNPAIALFLQRARAVRSDFSLTAANAATVAAICRRVDGLPLALELAAAWVKFLPPAALLARLEQPLPLLTGGARDLPERHQTLRGTVAWSYDLLSHREKALFRRLAVFVGGCTVAAVESMCRAGDGMGEALLGWLASLLDKNLLVQLQTTSGEEDEPRFGMLETVRDFGLECLAAVGELRRSRERHAAYFQAMAKTAEHALTGPQGHLVLARLDREQDNLRAAREFERGVGLDDDFELRLAAIRS